MKLIKAIIILTLLTGCATVPETKTCSRPEVLNKSNYPLSEKDWKVLVRVIKNKRCKKLYTDATCVKEFWKLGKTDYYIRCGK